MQICIHRGATQIGGSCVELKYKQQRLLIDLGLPLDAEDNQQSALAPSLNLSEQSEDELAVIISHPHIDHYGLAHHLPQDIPVYMGKAAKAIVKASSPFTRQPEMEFTGGDLVDRQTFQIGEFHITPYLVDHSAYDAYSLLIEAGGRRVFYSGDFRGHGRKAALFEKMLTSPPASIHALLMEGTSIGKKQYEEIVYPTEAELEKSMAEAFKATAGLAMVHASAQNIDRMVTLFRAAKRTGRKLIIDLYTAAILEATGNKNLPQSDWDGVAVYIPQAQRRQIKAGGWFDLLERHRKNRIYEEEIAKNASQYVLLFRPLHRKDLTAAQCLNDAQFIYSMWQGYWDSGSYAEIKEWLEQHQIPMQSIHTSGHADPQTLKRFVHAMQPGRLVPIHSFSPEQFSWVYDSVEPHADGEWWQV